MIRDQRDEKIYLEGQRSAWRAILSESIQHLDPSEKHYAALLEEREAALRVLRNLCEDFGDNDWTGDMELSHIIEKHLGKHLYADKEV